MRAIVWHPNGQHEEAAQAAQALIEDGYRVSYRNVSAFLGERETAARHLLLAPHEAVEDMLTAAGERFEVLGRKKKTPMADVPSKDDLPDGVSVVKVGGGWYEIRRDGKLVDKVQGEKAALRAAAELG